MNTQIIFGCATFSIYCLGTLNATADRTGGDASPRGTGIIYVDIDSPGGDGSSWANALPDLHVALLNNTAQIWVAEGIYSTNSEWKNPAVSFTLRDSVDLYGGFQGNETSLEQRDPQAHTTTLTGDDIAFHVVSTEGSATIDGFTITGGNAVGTSGARFNGGGILIGGVTQIQNCIITENYATSNGGGIYNDSYSVSIADCVFEENEAGSMGGAIYTTSGATEVFDSTFINNGAAGGGAIFTDNHSPIGDKMFVNRCSFTKNYISVDGGEHEETGGAAIKIYPNTDAVITNSLFTGNFSNIHGMHGGIIDASGAGGGGDFVKIINCTIAYNRNLSDAPAVNGRDGNVALKNSIVWQNSGHFGTSFINQLDEGSLQWCEYSIIALPDPPTWMTIINADPMFQSARGADGVFGTGDENFNILPYSPAIDHANPGVYPTEYGDGDLDGNWRQLPDPYTYDGYSDLDIGCYEYTPQSTTTNGFRAWAYHNNDIVDFNTDSLWEPAIAPSANDVAIINAPCGFTPTVTFSADTSVKTLLMPQGFQKYQLQGKTLTCSAFEPVRIGHYAVNDFALLRITGGTIEAHSFDLAGTNNASFAAMFLEDTATLSLVKGFVLRDNSLLSGGGTIESDVYNSGKVEFDLSTFKYPTITGNYFMTDNSTEGLVGSGGLSYMLTPINGTPSLGYDELSVGGVATLGGGLQIRADNNFPPQVGDIMTILNATGGIEGTFDSIWSWGFGADKVPVVSIVANQNGIGDSVIVTIQSVSQLLGFGTPDGTGLSSAPADAKIGDLDGDGDGDLVLSLPDENSVLILFNSGSPTGSWGGFNGGAQQISVGNNPAGVTVGDLDEDGDMDIAVANTDDDTVSALENTSASPGNITFTTYTHSTDFYASDPSALEARPTDVTHGNFSSGSYVDLAIANNGDSQMVIFEGPIFTNALMPGGSNHATNGNARDIDPGDVNNDKDFEPLVVTGDDGQSSVFKGSGFATSGYGAPTPLSMGGSMSQQIIADLDSNGECDLIVANPDESSITIALQATDGSYSTPVTIELTAGAEPSSITALDIDSDGDLDLAIVMTNEDNIKVTKIFRNDTSGTAGVMFTDIDLEEGATLTPIMALSSDIDNDGSTDLIMITQTGSNFTEEFSGYSQTVVNDHENSIPCHADFDGNGNVAVADLLVLIAAWGPGTGPEDLNGNGMVNVADLLLLIGAWGACP